MSEEAITEKTYTFDDAVADDEIIEHVADGLTAECETCGNTLRSTFLRGVLRVEPCECCIESSYDTGYDSGYSEGSNETRESAYNEGYDEGHNNGWESAREEFEDADITEVREEYQSTIKHLYDTIARRDNLIRELRMKSVVWDGFPEIRKEA